MSGNLFQLAKRDAKRFVSNGGFEEFMELVTPDKSKSITLTGFATKHWINFDTDGSPINSKNVHVTIDEDKLVLENYPVRNAKEEINLLNHIVIFKDSSGLEKKYKVRENFPDETLGLIVLILGDYREWFQR